MGKYLKRHFTKDDKWAHLAKYALFAYFHAFY